MPAREKLRSPRFVRRLPEQIGERGGGRRSGRARGTRQLQLVRWRRNNRDEEVQRAIAATETLRWSRELIEMLLEELCVDELFEVNSASAGTLNTAKVPRMLAAAVILRHSWHPDDLDGVLQRLGILQVR